MTYYTVEGVFRKLQQDLYDETEIESRIEEYSVDVSAWINSAVGRTVDFTEEELTGEYAIIRLASECYCACMVMSRVLEGHGIDDESLARYRCAEAKEHINMFCANQGILPAYLEDFDVEGSSEVQTEYGYAGGTDAVTIGTSNQ